MFVGGCAGSTAGGIKASRIAIYIKQAFGHLKQTISPNRTIVLKQERRPLNQDALISSGNYLALYTFSFIIFLIIASINAPDFLSSFSAVAATLNNIGPGLGVIGPASSYASLSSLSKATLSVAMIAGRLEIVPVLVMFSPRMWKRY